MKFRSDAEQHLAKGSSLPRDRYEIMPEVIRCHLVRSADMHAMQIPAACARSAAARHQYPVALLSQRRACVHGARGECQTG
jgi:hypothetical protein